MGTRCEARTHRLLRAAIGLSLLTSACSADSVHEPAPTLETPGVFVARQTPGGWLLHRTLAGINLTPERLLLFLASYPPEVPTLGDARARAKGPTPTEPPPALVITELDQFLEARIEVLWFRSLTDTDRELAP